ncbi:MAG: hypothetical protein AABY87_09415 [bacterium]
MIKTEDSYKCFEETLLGVRDDSGLVCALVLDALYAWGEQGQSCSILSDILVRHEDKLSVQKLHGIMGAVDEYQLLHAIPDHLAECILRLLESRVTSDEPDDYNWVKIGFCILRKNYSFKRLSYFVGIALSPYRMPDVYVEPYLSTLRAYINIAKNSESFYCSFAADQRTRIEERISEEDPSLERMKSYLKSISDLLSCESVDQPIDDILEKEIPTKDSAVISDKNEGIMLHSRNISFDWIRKHVSCQLWWVILIIVSLFFCFGIYCSQYDFIKGLPIVNKWVLTDKTKDKVEEAQGLNQSTGSKDVKRPLEKKDPTITSNPPSEPPVVNP